MLKCTINGQEIEVKEGTTIIEAFKFLKEDIAHYCWHPALSIAGVCRLCMVKIEGNPRLQIACNTVVTEGMVISNQDAEVKEAAKWGLDFHLINHPLDCPICDQAGECGLQDQYMKFGKYDPNMAENKVKKHKVVDLGERVVLDSERCILCSRCVRFTEEITKTNELGIFNRGDRSEIGTFEGKPLNNNYSVNTVDICPVGALTSKDFRFKQRVWFLKEAPSVCIGCSTGCNVSVHHNREGVWRLKPVVNEEVNGYWMCDIGRDTYKHTNRNETLIEGERDHKKVTKVPSRLLYGRKRQGGLWLDMAPHSLAKEIGAKLSTYSPDEVALVVTGQHTVEELDAMVGFFKNNLGSSNVFYWVNQPEKFEEFDGLLKRGDENPNTKGVLQVLEKHGLQKNWKELTDKVGSSIKVVLVLGPENQRAYPDFAQKVQELAGAELYWATCNMNSALDASPSVMAQIPLRAFIEKAGTFINYKGLHQKILPVTVMVDEALTGEELARSLAGEGLSQNRLVFNSDIKVQNEFVFKRGEL